MLSATLVGYEVGELGTADAHAFQRNDYWASKLGWGPWVKAGPGGLTVALQSSAAFPHDLATGHNSLQVAQATAVYQQANGLTVDHILGPLTWRSLLTRFRKVFTPAQYAALEKKLGGPAVPREPDPVPTPRPLRPDLIPPPAPAGPTVPPRLLLVAGIVALGLGGLYFARRRDATPAVAGWR